MNDCVDLVYLWCDAADPILRKKRESFLPEEKRMAVKNEEVGDCRYQSHDELRYSLRSVAKFLPWINTIHIVVDDDQSLPNWLNVDNRNIKIHRHSEIIPAKYLPTFNSRVIEFWLSNIPGLSERFIYANDDMMVYRSLKSAFFFNADGYPYGRFLPDREVLEYREGQSSYLTAIRNSILFAKEKFGYDFVAHNGGFPHHNMDAYLKSECAAFNLEYARIVDENSCYRFRSDKQIQRIIYSLWSLSRNKMALKPVEKSHNYDFIFGGADSCYKSIKGYSQAKLRFILRLINPGLFCLNDTSSSTEYGFIEAKKALNAMYPEKSAFERDDVA